MQSNAATFMGNELAARLLGIVAALIVAAVLFNIRMPCLATDPAYS